MILPTSCGSAELTHLSIPIYTIHIYALPSRIYLCVVDGLTAECCMYRIRLRIRENTLRHSLANCDTPKDRTRTNMNRRNVLYFCFDFLFLFDVVFFSLRRQSAVTHTRICYSFFVCFVLFFFFSISLRLWSRTYWLARFVSLSRSNVLGIEFCGTNGKMKKKNGMKRDEYKMILLKLKTRNIKIIIIIMDVCVEWKSVYQFLNRPLGSNDAAHGDRDRIVSLLTRDLLFRS